MAGAVFVDGSLDGVKVGAVEPPHRGCAIGATEEASEGVDAAFQGVHPYGYDQCHILEDVVGVIGTEAGGDIESPCPTTRRQSTQTKGARICPIEVAGAAEDHIIDVCHICIYISFAK